MPQGRLAEFQIVLPIWCNIGLVIIPAKGMKVDNNYDQELGPPGKEVLERPFWRDLIHVELVPSILRFLIERQLSSLYSKAPSYSTTTCHLPSFVLGKQRQFVGIHAKPLTASITSISRLTPSQCTMIPIISQLLLLALSSRKDLLEPFNSTGRMA